MAQSIVQFLRNLNKREVDRLLPYSGHVRGQLVGFESMAVRCQNLQPFPVQSATPKAATPAMQPQRFATNTANQRIHHNTRSAAPAKIMPTRVTQAASGQLTLSGKLADVCAELERMVRFEEQHALRMP